MSTASAAMGTGERARLDGVSRVVGPARVAGHLFDLGAYPGLVVKVAGGGGSGVVEGELRELHDEGAVFSWLDRYEGIDPIAPDDSEYRRELRKAWLTASGTEQHDALMAWVYIYQGPLDSAHLIAGGRWPG